MIGKGNPVLLRQGQDQGNISKAIHNIFFEISLFPNIA
jgi:hypothetical protein